MVVNRADPENPEAKQLVFLKQRDIDVRKIRSVSRTIAELGLEGWELVSHTQSQSPQSLADAANGSPWTEFFTFKRPIHHGN